MPDPDDGIVTIGQLCDQGVAHIQTGPFGSQLHAHDYRPTGTEVIPTEAIGRRRIVDMELPRVDDATVARLARHKLLEGDILFARRGAQATGLSAIIEKSREGALCGTGAILMRIAARKRISPAYLSFALSAPAAIQWLKDHAVGAVMPNLNADVIRRLAIRLPPITIQQAIADALGALDDKIELNRRMNETLEALARALFQSWFISFDPVRAKAAGRAPAGMDGAIASLFPDSFQETELGPTPTGWRVVPLSELFDLDKGVSYKGDHLREDGAPMVNLGCFLGDGKFAPDRVKGYAGEVRDRHWVTVGDLLLANTDMTQNRVILGSPALVPQLEDHQRALFSHHVFAARFRRSDATAAKLFCYYALLQPDFRRRAAGFATGTTVLALPRDAVLKLQVILPPEQLLERFMDIAGPLRARADHNSAESRLLANTRDALLPPLLSGEVRVNAVERLAL